MRLAVLSASALILLSSPGVNAQVLPAGAAPVAAGQIRGSLADSTNGQAVAIGSITIRRQRDTS